MIEENLWLDYRGLPAPTLDKKILSHKKISNKHKMIVKGKEKLISRKKKFRGVLNWLIEKKKGRINLTEILTELIFYK